MLKINHLRLKKGVKNGAKSLQPAKNQIPAPAHVFPEFFGCVRKRVADISIAGDETHFFEL
jgi:hypothetical protein